MFCSSEELAEGEEPCRDIKDTERGLLQEHDSEKRLSVYNAQLIYGGWLQQPG